MEKTIKPKRDLSLLLGISLPVLMVIVITLSVYLPGLFIKPKTNFIYSVGYSSCGQYEVKDGKLKFTVSPYYTSRGSTGSSSLAVPESIDNPCLGVIEPIPAATGLTAVTGATTGAVTVSGSEVSGSGVISGLTTPVVDQTALDKSIAIAPVQTIETLYLYDVSSNSAKTITPIEAEAYTLGGEATSPDGFKVQGGSYGSVMPMLSTLFWVGSGSYGNSGYYLSGRGIAKELNLAGIDQNNYYNFRFLGWVK